MGGAAAAIPVVVVRAAACDAELAADWLIQVGAWAVEERAVDGGEVELRAVLGGRDAPSPPASWSVTLEHVDPRPLDTWRQHAEPIVVMPDLVIRPAWLAPVGSDAVEVAIEPGAAFGLGDHPTTRLVTELTWRSIRPGARVIDVGCGTGVVAIAALLAGAASALAIDISPAAIEATVDNAERNGVAERLEAATTPLAEVGGTFDLVVANIGAPVLIDLAPDLARVTGRDGALLISGLLAERSQHALDALAPMVVTAERRIDGWAAFVLRHQSAG